MATQRSVCWAALLLVLALSTKTAFAGLIIENDGSDLCAANLKTCTSSCAPPQSFLFMCNSGGIFDKPYSDCKCVTPPPAGAQTDGSATFEMVQWPGPDACQSNSWLYDCAQWINVQAMSNNIQGQATDQASAMAAMAAMQAAQEAQAAAVQDAQQQTTTGGAAGGQPAMPGQGTAGVLGLDPSAGAAPAMGGAGMGAASGTGMASGAGTSGTSSMSSAGMGGTGMGMSEAGMQQPMGGAGMQQPTSSLMGNNVMGHRHLLQAGTIAGGVSAAGPTAMPTTSLSAACQKPIQGLVTAAGGGVMVIPNFKGVATMMTRKNDTMFIQLGGQGSKCVAAYKLKSGQIMDLGRPTDAPAAAKSAACAAAVSVAAKFVLVLVTLLLAA